MGYDLGLGKINYGACVNDKDWEKKIGLTKRKYEGAGLLEERKEGNKGGGWQTSIKSQRANIFYSTGHMTSYKFLIFSNEEGALLDPVVEVRDVAKRPMM